MYISGELEHRPIEPDLADRKLGGVHADRKSTRAGVEIVAGKRALSARVELAPGIDEVSLALVADAWSRTYRSRSVTFAATTAAVESRNGVRILPDQVAADWPAAQHLPPLEREPPAKALDLALRGIEARYGTRTADFVAMQLEYPR